MKNYEEKLFNSDEEEKLFWTQNDYIKSIKKAKQRYKENEKNGIIPPTFVSLNIESCSESNANQLVAWAKADGYEVEKKDDIGVVVVYLKNNE